MKTKNKLYAVEYAGYWHLQFGDKYGDTDILNAENVGVCLAQAYAEIIVELWNNHLTKTNNMDEFKQYRRKSISEMRPYVEGETLSANVSISQADKDAGSPKVGDMIARNPKNHDDQWLVAEKYFKENLEPI